MSILTDLRAALDECANSIMLCCGLSNAIRESLVTVRICTTCGQSKDPHGRRVVYSGGCNDTCKGYRDDPYPSNLFPGEQAEVRELFSLLIEAAPALLDVVEAAEHEPRCPFCAEERHMAGWPTQPHLSDCPLAPLVKEV